MWKDIYGYYVRFGDYRFRSSVCFYFFRFRGGFRGVFFIVEFGFGRDVVVDVEVIFSVVDVECGYGRVV